MNSKEIFKYVLFFGVILFALYAKSTLITFLLFVLFIIWDSKFIIPILLITPSIESIFHISSYLTIIKLLTLFLSFYFIVNLIGRKIQIDKNTGWLFLFLLINVFGSVYGMLGLNTSAIYQAASLNIQKVYFEIIFTILFYHFLKQKGIDYLRGSLKTGVIVIPISLIILLSYFILWGHSTITWWNIMIRKTLTGADPNEFSSMISTLGSFGLYLSFYSRTKIFSILGLGSIAILIYSVTLTLSRGGLLTLAFMFMIVLLVLSRSSVNKTIRHAVVISIVVISFVQFGLINVNAIKQRFSGPKITDLNTLTANRYDLWIAGFEDFVKRPLLGYGNTPKSTKILMARKLNRRSVIHNTYLEVLLRMGIVGLITFMLILWKSIEGGIIYFKHSDMKKDAILLVPVMSLVVMCFAAISLSWQWREMLWFLISISLASSQFMRHEYRQASSFPKYPDHRMIPVQKWGKI